MTHDTDPPRAPAAPSSDELLRLMVESAVDFAIYSVDHTGRVTSWNTGAERLLGYTSEQVVGSDGDVVFTPEDRMRGAPEGERLRAGRDGRAENERWHLRRDGSRFWGSGLLMPLRAHADGFVNIMRDRTAEQRTQQEVAESEARFRMLATSIPQLVFRTRSDGMRTWGSPQWEVYAGLSDARSRDFGWLDAIHPDDRAATLAGWESTRDTGLYSVEHRIRRAADGQYRWHQTRATPLHDAEGGTAEWVGTSTDIHELRDLQDRQRVLLAELQHRTRNLLALVQAMVRRTVRGSSSMETFITEYESRLQALSRVQGLVARTTGETMDLHTLIKAEFNALGDGENEQARIEGPPIELPAAAVQALALALHELATNAVKYGALSQPEGRLTVTWHEEDDGTQRRLVLDWRETGVAIPAQATPRRKGYGSELIERALPYQLGARTVLEFAEDGVRCSIVMPISSAPPGPRTL